MTHTRTHTQIKRESKWDVRSFQSVMYRIVSVENRECIMGCWPATSCSSTVTHSNNTGFWIHDSTTVGDETFWPQYIILTQSGPLTHTCLQGANVSLDRLLERKQRNRQKDSADLYPLRSAPLLPSNFSPLLSSPTPFNLPIISSSSHFPFLLASFRFIPCRQFSLPSVDLTPQLSNLTQIWQQH